MDPLVDLDQNVLADRGEPCRSAHIWGMNRNAVPEHRSIVVVDIAASSRWDNLAALSARAALARLVQVAFRSAGIARWKLAIEDRGDGMIVLVHASVSKVDLLDPFIPNLIAGLRVHNAVADAGLRIRLRVAIHAGEVIRATPGWVGADLNLACRLVDGPPLYDHLAQSPSTDLVLAVSNRIHDGIIRHAYRTIIPADYRPVRVTLKEVDVDAWLLTAGPTMGNHHRVRAPAVTHGASGQ